MKLAKTVCICCALLAACTLSACEVSDQPLEPVTGNHAEDQYDVSVTEMNGSEGSGGQSAEQNGASGESASAGASGDAAPAQDNQAAQNGQAAENQPAAQDAQQQDNASAADSGDSYKIGSEPSLSIGVVHAKAGQKSVPVTVKINHNPGFCAGGIRVYYDEAIKPQYDPESFQGVSDKGIAVGSAMSYCSVAPENLIVAFGILGQEDSKEDGPVFTCYFDIPDNAPSGKVYKLKTELAELKNSDSQNVELKMIGGEIRID